MCITHTYTHENDEEIAALYRGGETGKSIGVRFGITDVTVFRALERQGIARRPGHPPSTWEATETNRRDLISAYEAGESIRAIARRLHINTRRVMLILNASSLEERHPGGRRRFSDEQAAEFASAYEAGNSLTQIGLRHGVAAQVVRRYLLRSGITLRPVGAPTFWTREREAEAISRHQSGEQLKDIAAAMGCGTHTLAKTLAALGVREIPAPKEPGGPGHHSWRGGRVVSQDGYVHLRIIAGNRDLVGDPVPRTGYALEHRLVMAQKLGRPLRPEERPHHKNLIRADNRPENLELWLTSQPPGARVADLIAWSLDLLNQYMPEALVPGWQELPLPEAVT